MRKSGRLLCLIVILALFLSFDSFAMENYYEFIPPEPGSEMMREDGRPSDVWTWVSDELCVQTGGTEKESSRAYLREKYDWGLLSRWNEKIGEEWQIKKRDTYNGKWSQSETGIWSFKFDDKTIPIELTKIDGVLYAFNGYGELVDGIEYWNGYKTGADGIVTCTDPEFLKWMETQYIPECTTAKAE